MRIYIPTKGRVGQQLTFKNLPRELQAITTIVCPSNEARRHLSYLPTSTDILAQPDEIKGISEKRRWIIEMTEHEKIVMLDDDLRFAVRRDDDDGKFRAANSMDIIKAFTELEIILDAEVPHAGFSARGGGIGDAARRGGWQCGKRMMYVIGLHVPTILREVSLGRLSTHEDFDITLQLLTKGYPNMVNYSFVVDQKFGSPGGCEEERTVEINNADALKLAEFFPQFVAVRQRDYAGSTPRMEVTVQWLKALKWGETHRDPIDQ